MSKHHIMSRLAKENRVLWINSIGMRTPTASSKDIAKIGQKLRTIFRSVKQVQKNLYVISPLVIPFHGSSMATRINRRLLLLQLRYYKKSSG